MLAAWPRRLGLPSLHQVADERIGRLERRPGQVTLLLGQVRPALEKLDGELDDRHAVEHAALPLRSLLAHPPPPLGAPRHPLPHTACLSLWFETARAFLGYRQIAAVVVCCVVEDSRKVQTQRGRLARRAARLATVGSLACFNRPAD
jgi:hypothetical protein